MTTPNNSTAGRKVRVHCVQRYCEHVAKGASVDVALLGLEEHMKSVHKWPTHDVSGNFIADKD